MNVNTTPKLTREQKIEMVEAWRRSGLSQQAFADIHSIPVASLGYWVKEHRTKWSKQPTPKSKSAVMKEYATANNLPFIELEATRIHQPAEPDWRKLYEDEKAKVEALQKVIAVLGFQL